MKRPLLLLLILAGCASGRNELMTRLVNEKKMIEDSVPVLKKRADDLINQIVDKKIDSAAGMRQAVQAADKADSLRIRLSAVNFSIDSLQKMK